MTNCFLCKQVLTEFHKEGMKYGQLNFCHSCSESMLFEAQQKMENEA